MSKIAQVAEPQRGVDQVGIAALDHAVQYLPAGALPDIGVHHRYRGVTYRVQLEHRGQVIPQAVQALDVGCIKSVSLFWW